MRCGFPHPEKIWFFLRVGERGNTRPLHMCTGSKVLTVWFALLPYPMNTPMNRSFLIGVLLSPMLFSSCIFTGQLQQSRLEQERREWRLEEYKRRLKESLEAHECWKTELARVVAAEFVHRSLTEENLTPEVMVRLSAA